MTGAEFGVHEWSPEQLRRAVMAAGVALWAWDFESDAFTMDAQGFDLWGLEWRKVVTFEELSAKIHPADRYRVRSAFMATRAMLGPHETDFRIVVDGTVRWVAARGQGGGGRPIDRTVFGIFLDVTGRKQAEEGNELLAGEMSHRVKNLLSIATSLTSLSSRSAASAEEMANELIGRLTALGRAHDLVRPLPGGQGNAALLGDLITVLLAPYDDLGAFKGRIRVAVERMGVGKTASTALALVVHELATNSMKYGALASPIGTLDVSSISEGEMLVITWLERGGPQVEVPDRTLGFGSQLVQRSVAGQLGGTIDYDWNRDGLIVTLKVSRARLAL
ncbi:sensor histidine kinase [Sphingomonas sp. 22176]|uniref:sensor histidine kinase n=1 Tax=Sphingomonas sp. 22176 TaxID=3453884 RepID=UPI003F877761